MTRTITIPAGTVLVLDIKTGGLNPNYSRKYAPQLAAYAAAVPYDPETDTRSTWPWPIDQDVALIAHIPVADLLATGRCDISLVPVDLAAGRHAAELCVAAKAWNARRDIFGTPVPVVTAIVDDERTYSAAEIKSMDEHAAGDPSDGLTSTLGGDAFTGLERVPLMAQHPSTAAKRFALNVRAATLKATHPDAAKWVAARWPAGVPPLKGDAPLTDADLDAIDGVLTQAEAHFAAPFGDHDVTLPTPTAKPVEPPQRATWQRPEEGPTIHDDEVAELRASIKRLPGTASARVQRWLGDAQANGRKVMPDDGKHTMRSQTIIQAMANCALVDDFVGDDEFLRVVLAATLGTDAALFGNVSIGACFGSLTIAEAERLRLVAERYFDGKVTVGFDSSGAAVLAGELDGLGVAA